MYTITKRMEISAAHKLVLPYQSKCTNLHGHNWIIEVEICAPELNKAGMVIDFGDIKGIVNHLDHTTLNDFFHSGTTPGKIIKENPTAENIARWIADNINQMLNNTNRDNLAKVSKVIIQESEGNKVCYIP